MRTPLALWIVALLLTLASAAWQRSTGPTYPVSGRAAIAGESVAWTFERTQKGAGDHTVTLRAPDSVTGVIEWRRHGVAMIPIVVPMTRRGDRLEAALPWQPPAGVLRYAFGFWWTGRPIGTDITDNKTLVALAGWIVAGVALHRAANPKPWVLGAALLMFLVFMIPHSWRGTGCEEPAGSVTWIAPAAPCRARDARALA